MTFNLNPWPKSKILKALAFIWILPIALVGLILGFLIWLDDKTVAKMQGGCLEINASHTKLGQWMNQHWSFGNLCTCVGWVFMIWGFEWSDRYRCHEQTHVRRQLQLGPFYILLYMLFSLIALIKTKSIEGMYHQNWFEIEAYNNERKFGKERLDDEAQTR